jgi:hypothetical protein
LSKINRTLLSFFVSKIPTIGRLSSFFYNRSRVRSSPARSAYCASATRTVPPPYSSPSLLCAQQTLLAIGAPRSPHLFGLLAILAHVKEALLKEIGSRDMKHFKMNYSKRT